MADIEFDVTELTVLAADINTMSVSAVANAAKALEVTANKVKAMAASGYGGGHFRHVGRSINYDIKSNREGTEVEIGADRSAVQGRLAHFAEGTGGDWTGASNFGGYHALERSLAKNLEDFQSGLAKAVLGGFGS